MKSTLFTSAAEADVEEALQWYDSQRPGLGAAFLHALDIAVMAVVSNPEAYAVIHRQIRRALLPKFPYGLFYRVLDETIIVIACLHAKRHPRAWRTR